MSTGKFAVGQLVLVPDERLVCRPCRVLRCTGYPPRMAITLEALEGGAPFAPTAHQAELVSEVDPLALDGAPDLVKLTHLNEFAILQNLRARYARDEVYTFVGTILVAINPFKDVSRGDDAVLARARGADARAWDELPPHVYVLAEGAYRAALRERKPQAILISGESGAGKTESTKLWLRHLVSRSQGAGDGGGSAASRIEASLLHCNPVLETYGNAATTRNHNSSRFGKWTEVSLDARSGGTISSARLTSYLLERSRVTGHAPGERAFHAFYSLLAAVGADPVLAERLSLEAAPAAYRYLRAGADGTGGAAALRADDRARRSQCGAALAALGFAREQAAALDAVVAAVLHVGNVLFDAASAGEHQDEGAAIAPATAPHLRSAAALLGVDVDAVADALTVRLVGRFPAVRVPLSVGQSGAQRDALSRALYAALFEEHLFAELNRAMHGISAAGAGGGAGGAGGVDGAPASSGPDGLYVGCLDIFGFECFASNGLEQLLINYANERLHHLFNVHVFEMDVAQLTADGIELLPGGRSAELVYGENAGTLQALHGARGGSGAGSGRGGGSLLSLLSEEAALPNGSDANFLGKAIDGLRESGAFLPPRGGAAERGFGVRHYAGAVSYCVDGFVEKNRNAVPADLVALLAGSAVPFLRGVFGEAKRQADSAASGAGGGARTRGAPGARKPGARGASVAALSAVFARSLDALLERLGGTSLHFVRCVKPNATLAPDRLDADLALVQLRYMGMLAVAEVRKRGYAHRMAHAAFLERYSMLLPRDGAERALGAQEGEPRRAACAAFFGALPPALAARAAEGADEGGALRPFAVGRTLVCMRAPLHAALEAAREEAVRAQLLECVKAESAAPRPDVSRLHEVVSLALEVGLGSEPAVQSALKMLRLLREREEVAAALGAQLERARGGGGGGGADCALLEELIARARVLGVDGALIGQAEVLLRRARDSAEAEAALRAALRTAGTGAGAADGPAAAGGTSELRALIARAASLDVSAELLQQARREAEAADERGRVLGALRAAVAQRASLSEADVSRLADALARAAVIGLARAPEVAAAQALVDEEGARRQQRAPEPLPAPGRGPAAEGSSARALAARDAPSAAADAADESDEDELLSTRLGRLGAQSAAPQLSPLCQPIAQRLAQLEAGVRASCFFPAAKKAGPFPFAPNPAASMAAAPLAEWYLVDGTLSLSADHLTLVWTPSGQPAASSDALANLFGRGAPSSRAKGGEQLSLQSIAQAAQANLQGIAQAAQAAVQAAAGGGPSGRPNRAAGARAIAIAVGEMAQIAIGPQSRDTRESFKREKASRGGASMEQYHVMAVTYEPEAALGSSGASGAGGRGGALHVEFVLSDADVALLCVCTLEELCVKFGAPAGRRGAFGALQRAQSQWYEFAAGMGSANLPPALPLLAPLFDLLDAAATWLQVATLDYNCLWLLVEMVEAPLPPGLVWVPVESARRPGRPPRLRAAICEEATGRVLRGHPYEQSFRDKLQRCLRQPRSAKELRDETDPHELVEDALSWRGRAPAADGALPGAGGAARRARAAAAAPPGVQVYQAILGGAVDKVARYLELGGTVDAYYRTEWGWEGVSSDWAWTQPEAGTTPLNYVATLLDIVGDDVAAQMARALLEGGADPLCDDCMQQWFLPVHNAAACGGPLTVAELLRASPGLANSTTGEGQTTLFVAALCERPADRQRVLRLLLEHGADTAFVEPFRGDTPLHEYARRGLSAEVALLRKAGADAAAQNNAGHTPCAAAERALEDLLSNGAAGGSEQQEGAPQLADRANGLRKTIELLRLR